MASRKLWSSGRGAASGAGVAEDPSLREASCRHRGPPCRHRHGLPLNYHRSHRPGRAVPGARPALPSQQQPPAPSAHCWPHPGLTI